MPKGASEFRRPVCGGGDEREQIFVSGRWVAKIAKISAS